MATPRVDSKPGSGAHRCWTYSDDDAWSAVLGDYFAAGLAANERLAFVGGEELLRSVVPRSFPLDDLVEQGRLLVASTAHVHLPDGAFDADARLAAYEALVGDAIAEGFGGLRVAADATQLLAAPSDSLDWPAYELRADLLSRRLPFHALCAYDARACDATGLEVTCAVHGHRVVNGHAGEPRFQLHAGDGCLVLGGEVDLTCARVVRALIVRAAGDLERLRVDISGLSFVDVAGMTALAEAARELGSRFAEMVLEGASETFRRIWSLLELDSHAEIRLASGEETPA